MYTDRGGFTVLRIHTETHVGLGRMEAGVEEDLFLIGHWGDPVKVGSEINQARIIATGAEIAVYVNADLQAGRTPAVRCLQRPYPTSTSRLGLQWPSLVAWMIF